MAMSVELEVVPSGHNLLRNFLQRRTLGLLPWQRPLASAEPLPRSRIEALATHHTFGYHADRLDVVVCARRRAGGTTGLGKVGAVLSEDDATLELLERRDALQAQLAELDGDLEAARSRSATISGQVASRQEEMARAVDEHGALSKALAEAHARSHELQREEARLRAALSDQGAVNSHSTRGAAAGTAASLPIDSGSNQASGASFVEDAAAAKIAASPELLAKQMALHRQYLLLVEGENRALRMRAS